MAKRYNAHGPGGMVNRQHTTAWRALRLLSAAQQEGLRQALAGPAPDTAKRWRARDVADWMAAKLGRTVATQRGWDYLQRLTHSQQVPRPQHALADPQQQDTCKKKLRPLLRAVARAFPHAQVELWATDEQRMSNG